MQDRCFVWHVWEKVVVVVNLFVYIYIYIYIYIYFTNSKLYILYSKGWFQHDAIVITEKNPGN